MDFWFDPSQEPDPDAPVSILREAADQFNERHIQLRATVHSTNVSSGGEQKVESLRYVLTIGRDTDKIDLGGVSFDVVSVRHPIDRMYPSNHSIIGERAEVDSPDMLRMILEQHFKSDMVQGVIRNLLDLYTEPG